MLLRLQGNQGHQMCGLLIHAFSHRRGQPRLDSQLMPIAAHTGKHLQLPKSSRKSEGLEWPNSSLCFPERNAVVISLPPEPARIAFPAGEISTAGNEPCLAHGGASSSLNTSVQMLDPTLIWVSAPRGSKSQCLEVHR